MNINAPILKFNMFEDNRIWCQTAIEIGIRQKKYIYFPGTLYANDFLSDIKNSVTLLHFIQRVLNFNGIFFSRAKSRKGTKIEIRHDTAFTKFYIPK